MAFVTKGHDLLLRKPFTLQSAQTSLTFVHLSPVTSILCDYDFVIHTECNSSLKVLHIVYKRQRLGRLGEQTPPSQKTAMTSSWTGLSLQCTCYPAGRSEVRTGHRVEIEQHQMKIEATANILRKISDKKERLALQILTF